MSPKNYGLTQHQNCHDWGQVWKQICDQWVQHFILAENRTSFLPSNTMTRCCVGPKKGKCPPTSGQSQALFPHWDSCRWVASEMADTATNLRYKCQLPWNWSQNYQSWKRWVWFTHASWKTKTHLLELTFQRSSFLAACSLLKKINKIMDLTT